MLVCSLVRASHAAKKYNPSAGVACLGSISSPIKTFNPELGGGVSAIFQPDFLAASTKVGAQAVSYTHLDVYKRQLIDNVKI